MKRKLQGLILRVTKRDFQLEHFFVLNVPTFQHVLRLISVFILQRSIAYPIQRIFASVNFVIKFLLVFIPCDYTDRRCTTHKVNRRPKIKMWCSYSEGLTMRALRKTKKRASTFFWTLRWRKGNIESSFLQWAYWIHTLWTKTRHSVRKAQVWSKVECCVWLSAQKCRRWSLSVLLCKKTTLWWSDQTLWRPKYFSEQITSVLSGTYVIEAYKK